MALAHRLVNLKEWRKPAQDLKGNQVKILGWDVAADGDIKESEDAGGGLGRVIFSI